MSPEEKEFRKELLNWLIGRRLVDGTLQDFLDSTEEAMQELCLENNFPKGVKKEAWEFISDPKFNNNSYVQDLKNKILAQSL